MEGRPVFGFTVGGKLNKISAEGGAVVPIGDVTNFAGASWDEDGSILVSWAFTKGLFRPEGATPLGIRTFTWL